MFTLEVECCKIMRQTYRLKELTIRRRREKKGSLKLLWLQIIFWEVETKSYETFCSRVDIQSESDLKILIYFMYIDRKKLTYIFERPGVQGCSTNYIITD